MAFDFSVTGNTKLDTSGFTQSLGSMTVAAGNLIADLVKTASSQLVGLAQSSIQTGSAYEVSLAKVGTIADLGKLSIQQLGDQVSATSNSMGIATTVIAEATYQAISAGQDTANAVAFAGQAAKLAAAGFTSTTSAVDILTTALNAYGLSADQADHVSDVLLTTQNLGKTSVDELSSSMGRVIPLAAAYNVSVENLSSGLAVMTANGIATAEATTYAKSMLNELGDTGSTVGKILQAETGKSFAQLNAEGKSLGDVLQILYDNVGGDSTAFAGLWSSVEAGTGALSLASGGADKFNGVLAQMVDSAGATDTAYQTMTDTFQHSMESLQTTAENLSIDLFEAMEPGLKEAANWGTDCLNTLTSALNEGGPAAMLDAASGILENLTAGVVQKIPGLTSAATQVITKLVQYLFDHQDEIFDAGIQLLRSLVQGIGENLPQLITAAVSLIESFASSLTDHLPEIAALGVDILAALIRGLLSLTENLAGAALDLIASFVQSFDDNHDQFWEIGKQAVAGLWQGIKDSWSDLLSNLTEKVRSLADTAKRVLGIHSPSKVFTEIGENVTQGLVNGINTGTPAAEQAIQNIAQTLSTYGPDFATVGATITDQFRTKLTEGWEQIQSDIQTDALGALNQLGSALSGVFGNLSQLAMGLVAQFVPAAASATTGQIALNTAMDANPILFVISLIGMLVGALLKFANTNKSIASFLKNLWYGVGDFISVVFEGIIRVLGTVIQGVVSAINVLIDSWNFFNPLARLNHVSNPLYDWADKIARERAEDQRKRKEAEEATQLPQSPSSSSSSSGSQKVIESMTDTSKTTRADGSTVTTKVLTEKLKDETGKITQRVTKTVTEAGTKLVDGVERSYKTVTTYVDGIQTKVERSLDDITKTSSSTGSTTPTAPTTPTTPTPDKDLTDAVEANTEALLAANSKLAEMVRQANSLVLSDNMAISRSVAASGTAQVAAAANQYHREGDTNITQNIYSKAQTAADLQREARWEADRAKAQKR